LQWSAAGFAVASACYSAFLFAQAKGRDLWQSPLFLWHLLVQSLVAGSGTIVIASVLMGAQEILRPAILILLLSMILGLSMIVGEIFLPHVGEDGRIATEVLVRGRLSRRFWGFMVAGLVAPIILAAIAMASVVPLAVDFVAAVFAIAGVWGYEVLWVKAGQAVPLS
jgi:formate-dependent nitrite reductase membrane component NrfD